MGESQGGGGASCARGDSLLRIKQLMRHRFCGLLHFASAIEPNGKMAVRQNRVAHQFSPRSSCAEMPPRLPMLDLRSRKTPDRAKRAKGAWGGFCDVEAEPRRNRPALGFARRGFTEREEPMSSRVRTNPYHAPSPLELNQQRIHRNDT